jgi:hypothetical protein
MIRAILQRHGIPLVPSSMRVSTPSAMNRRGGDDLAGTARLDAATTCVSVSSIDELTPDHLVIPDGFHRALGADT